MADPFKLLFKEQWWCLSTLSTLNEDEIKNKLPEIVEFTNKTLAAVVDGDINKTFVPEEKDRKLIALIAQNFKVSVNWISDKKPIVYESNGKNYKSVGTLAIRVRLFSDAVKKDDVRPSYLQQIVFLITGKIKKQFAENFLIEDAYPPYVFSIASGYNPAQPYIEWTPATVDKYKSEIGQWAEIYTGQFEDYRDETYKARVEGDLSNRKSEMHFINRNSALVYMDAKNYDLYFIKDQETPNSTGYVFSTILGTVVRVRNIQFFMQIVNNEIDKNQENLASDEYLKKPPKIIKDDLEKTNRLKNTVQGMLSPIWTDLTRSHRQHYASVLNRVVGLSNIKENWKTIAEKIDANARELNAVFMDKQEESSKRQESILGLVNAFLGASIVFELVVNILNNEDWSSLINQFLSIMLVIALGIVLLRLQKEKSKNANK